MRKSLKRVLWLALAILPVGGLLMFGAPLVNGAEKADARNDTYEMLNLFGAVFERVRSDYVEEVKDSDLIESAINGMLTALDPHSSYMNEKAFKEMQVQTRGEFGGLGIEVTMDNGLVKVISPIDDTPASKAGVLPGDYITMIDADPVLGLSLAEAVEKMRGPVDTKVKITIVREGSADPIELTLNRSVIRIQPVKAHPEDDIGYVRISSFSEQTSETMKLEIERLQKQMPRMKGLVLDLRNNPGGLLDQGVAVADGFLNKGEIVSTRERNPANTRRYNAHEGDLLNGAPIVVLINSGSASASEIVAGALQDHKRALILGTKSFGKGSVQTVIPLKAHGAMRLTTARYYTPSGHSIQAKGITPDITVQQAKIELVKSDRLRLEADLKGRLAGEEEKNSAEAKKAREAALKEAERRARGGKTPRLRTDGEMEPGEDFQLARALDLLRGLSVYKQLQAN